MKKIKMITVSTTYRVGIGGIEVPDNVMAGLEKMEDMSTEISDSDMILFKDKDVAAAFEWLSDNIRENDACDLSFEIESLTQNYTNL